MIVLDACAAVEMELQTEAGKALAQLLLQGEKAVSHGLFPVEVANVYWKYVRAGLLSAQDAQQRLSHAVALADEVRDANDLLIEATNEAVRLNHPVYDMLYFVLARREGATLFTVDRKLQSLCSQNNVDCICAVKLDDCE